MENNKEALFEVSNWEEHMTIEESKLNIAYYELKELIIDRIMIKYNLK